MADRAHVGQGLAESRHSACVYIYNEGNILHTPEAFHICSEPSSENVSLLAFVQENIIDKKKKKKLLFLYK